MTSKFTFYLGTDDPKFLSMAGVPLFISYRRLTGRKFTQSCCQWALDSGGFTELSKYGRWMTRPGTYAAEVAWWWESIPGMQWAATQDWMCESQILERTGLTVREHQRRTTESYLKLCEYQPRVGWLPVLQGFRPREYLDHVRQYEEVGVDLTELPVVGVGSVCRRQSEDLEEAKSIIRELYTHGVKLHAFGFKTTGLVTCHEMLVSADSMAWCVEGWRDTIDQWKTTGKRRCKHDKNPVHCLRCALDWRSKLLSRIS